MSAGSPPDDPVDEREEPRRPAAHRPLPPVPPSVPRRSPSRPARSPRPGPAPLPPPPYPMSDGLPQSSDERLQPPIPDGAGVDPTALPPVPPSRSMATAGGSMASSDDRPRRVNLPPVPPPARRRFVPGPDDTQLIPMLPPVPRELAETAAELQVREGAPGASTGILRAAGAMAVATLVSRVTGLLRTGVLAAAVGSRGLVPDAYNTSNTLPNIVYELLLGGVLSSVVVPLLVRAQERDRDGGVGYAQRLATVAISGLAVMTVVAVLCAPALTWISGIRDDPAQVDLANWLARLLLIEILFYGIGALATAILNSHDVFGPPAWAPVLNNVVVIATGVVFIAASGPGKLTPATIQPWEVWLLGIGTTLGIAVQALVLVPLLRRAGVPPRPRWGLRDTGLREAGTLGLWVVLYAAISQVGVLVATNVANGAGHEGGLGSQAFAISSLLFQMPYGIIGVALLTALLPRMSRAASRSDVDGVVRDLSLGTRLSALGLLPVTAALVVLGPALAVVGFARGQTSLTDAQGMGAALSLGAFGLLPMAVTLLQLRVFYAMRDAKTPTLIQCGMVAVRVPLLLLVPVLVPPSQVVAGLMVATSVTYIAGWIIGDVMLRRRFGDLRTGETLAPVLRIAAVSGAAGLLGEIAVRLVSSVSGASTAGSLVTLLIGTVVIGAAAIAGAIVIRVPEIQEPLAAVRARLGRG